MFTFPIIIIVTFQVQMGQKPKKTPAAQTESTMPVLTRHESLESMNKEFLALLQKPWAEHSKSEQEDILARMGSPAPRCYDKFHKSMAKNPDEIPKAFKEDLVHKYVSLLQHVDVKGM